jgi:hypothetical protein
VTADATATTTPQHLDDRASGLLHALAASLCQDLRGQRTELTINLRWPHLAIAYHHIVVVRWASVGDKIVAAPDGWSESSYTAAGVEQARRITIRLVFEFVRSLHDGLSTQISDRNTG